MKLENPDRNTKAFNCTQFKAQMSAYNDSWCYSITGVKNRDKDFTFSLLSLAPCDLHIAALRQER